jgi:hypothetical protein
LYLSPISEETREKISKSSIGRISTRKGKTYEEFYGVDKAKDLRSKLKNRKQPTKGKTYEEIYGVEKARELLEKED